MSTFPSAFTLFLVFALGSLGLVIMTLVDVVRMPNDASFKSGTQIVWVIVILLAGLIGAIIYLAVGRPRGGSTAARQHPAVPPPPPPPPSGTV
jgi:phospholipase D-like protein